MPGKKWAHENLNARGSNLPKVDEAEDGHVVRGLLQLLLLLRDVALVETLMEVVERVLHAN